MWTVYGCFRWRGWYVLVLMTTGWWIATITVIATGFPRWTVCWYFKWIIVIFTIAFSFSLTFCVLYLLNKNWLVWICFKFIHRDRSFYSGFETIWIYESDFNGRLVKLFYLFNFYRMLPSWMKNAYLSLSL